MQFVQNNIWLIMIAVVSGALLVWPWISRFAFGGAEVGASAAVQLINRKDALVIDVREPAEFQAGHIPEARNIPAGRLKERLAELDKHKARTIIVNCQTGSRSAGACALLRKQGFAAVFNLAGGIAAWQQAGLPLQK